MISEKEPVMLFGDMGFLPWFEFPQEYHFGGHTFIAADLMELKQMPLMNYPNLFLPVKKFMAYLSGTSGWSGST